MRFFLLWSKDVWPKKEKVPVINDLVVGNDRISVCLILPKIPKS